MRPKVYILAGGGGTRLKPLSQMEKGKLPKQFLKVVGSRTLLQEAICRIPEEFEIGVIPEKRFTEESYRQAAEMGVEITVLEEPFGCNTAAAILYATLYEQVSMHHRDRVLCFLPADHKMDTDEFRRLLQHAVQLAEKVDDVVTLGIEPDKPEIQYGYIKTGKPNSASVPSFRVEKFVEKPNRETALLYLEEGGYFWNAGIFIARTSVLVNAARKHCAKILNPIEKAVSLSDDMTMAEAYREIKESKWNISIDFALMEHIADRITLIPSPPSLNWNDLGNWESLSMYMKSDENRNETFSDALAQGDFADSTNSMICNYTDLPIRVEGCHNLLVVVTENGILVREKNQ